MPEGRAIKTDSASRTPIQVSLPGQAVSPLTATFSRVAGSKIGSGGIDFSSRVGVPDEPGWVPASDLAADGELLDDLLRRAGRGFGTGDLLVAGSLFLKSYLWRVIGPAVAAFLIDRRLPDLGPENVALNFDENGRVSSMAFVGGHFAALPEDPDAEHPGARVLCSEELLLGWMRERLAEDHLPDLYSALRRSRPRRGTRALWGSAVDVCAETFLYAGEALGCEDGARAFADRMLASSSMLSGPANYFTLEHDSVRKPTRTRNTCCLYYRLGNAACFTCPRTTNEERLRRLATGC